MSKKERGKEGSQGIKFYKWNNGWVLKVMETEKGK